MSTFSVIKDIDHKIDIIDHVNQDHPEELLAIAKSYVPDKLISSASVEDIYNEGMSIFVDAEAVKNKIKVFIPFEIEGSLEDKILYLAYASIVKQGGSFSGNVKHFFEVTEKQNITKNFIRLTIKSEVPLPEYYPGYAYALMLKKMVKKKTHRTSTNQKKTWINSIFDHLFVWLMKHLSKRNREKLLHKANKNVRLYTLRKSWKSSETATFVDRAYIDIYTHNNTPGSLWATQLNIGDVIMSRSETIDNHPHISVGQALLIADETAYPALAGIVECWKNFLPPVIIIISAKEEEQGYFSEQLFPIGSKVHRVVCPENKQADEVLTLLKEVREIETVWAALESAAAKKVRHYLRNERQIKGKKNHTKAYWVLK